MKSVKKKGFNFIFKEFLKKIEPHQYIKSNEKYIFFLLRLDGVQKLVQFFSYHECQFYLKFYTGKTQFGKLILLFFYTSFDCKCHVEMLNCFFLCAVAADGSGALESPALNQTYITSFADILRSYKQSRPR